MLPNLSEVATMREKLGLTQKELAEKAEVSRSLIAKIEASPDANPSYEAARRIFETLEGMEDMRAFQWLADIKASDLASKVITLDANLSVQEAWRRMMKLGISQFPLTVGGGIMATVSDADVRDAVLRGTEDVKDWDVARVAKGPLPLIDPDTEMADLVDLVKRRGAVLVKGEKGNAVGIVTNADFGKAMMVKGQKIGLDMPEFSWRDEKVKAPRHRRAMPKRAMGEGNSQSP